MLKKCDKCGDFQEIILPPLLVGGQILRESKKVRANCYCQQKEIEKQQQEALRQKENHLLMEKYKASELPVRFLNWDFNRVDNTENKRICQEYVDCFDINLPAGRGLFLIGEKGRGKTTLAVCMQKELIKQGYTSLIISFREVINKLLATNSSKALKTQRQVMDEFLKFDFIIFDDFGRESYTEKQLETAFFVIDEMNKNMKCLCLTANPEMIERLKTPRYYKDKDGNTKENPNGFKYANEFIAILDRINEMCKITLIFEGKSMRGKEND